MVGFGGIDLGYGDFFLFLGTALVTWAVTHWYYRRQNREVSRLIEEAKSAGLAVPDLVAILRDRVIDEEVDEPYPFKQCPECGSKDLHHDKAGEVVGGERDPGGGWTPDVQPYPTVECRDCGWSLPSESNDILGI